MHGYARYTYMTCWELYCAVDARGNGQNYGKVSGYEVGETDVKQEANSDPGRG
jgi:hypothetical protein